MPELPPEHAVALGNLLGEPSPDIPRPGAPAPVPEPEAEAPDPRDAQIQDLRDQLKNRDSHLAEANVTMRRMLDAIQTKTDAPQPAAALTDEQLDGMTPAQLTKHLIQAIGTGMDHLHQANVLEIAKIRLEGQLRDLYGNNPEAFAKHQEDIVNIVKEKRGTVSPEEALDIAMARAGRSAPREEEPEGEAPRPRVAATRGVTPGTRAGSGSRPGKPAPPPANAREAAQRAMKAIFPGGRR